MKNDALVLLVEDNDDHAYLITRLIERINGSIDVQHVPDGEVALDYLLGKGDYSPPGSAPRPDLVFLDLRLPKIDGLKVLRTVKETVELRDIPVVVLTSSEASRDLLEAYRAHANGYLLKPLDFKELGRMIESALEFWLEWNVPAR